MDLFPQPPRDRLHQLTTYWTEVEGLTASVGQDRDARWDRLLERYEAPIRAYLADVLQRTGGGRIDPDEVQDIAQSFFLGVFQGGWLDIDRTRIRSFRAYLQAILRRRVIDTLRHRWASKRSPQDGRVVPLDETAGQGLPAVELEGEQDEVLRLWARSIALRAVELMREKTPARGSAAAEVLVSLGLPAQHLVDTGKRSTPATRSRAKANLQSYVTAALLEALQDPGDIEQEWALFRQHIG